MKRYEFSAEERMRTQLVGIPRQKMMRLCLWLTAASFVLAAAGNVWIHPVQFRPDLSRFVLDVLVPLCVTLPMFLVHELLHALGFVLCGARIGEISFGCNLRAGILYCACPLPLTPQKYRFVALLPFCVTLLGTLAAILFGNVWWCVCCAVLIGGAAGDLIAAKRARALPRKVRILDHPFLPAYYVIWPEGGVPQELPPLTKEAEQALEKEYFVSGK